MFTHPTRLLSRPLLRLSSTPRSLYPLRTTIPHAQLRAMSAAAVLDASELAEGQMKAVEFDGGKVLLSNVKGEIHATSAFCSHYGAPLEKGVLSADGRLVCPWHGACFNVRTGDIEDAPGLDSLYKYDAKVEDGKIVVSANCKEVAAKVGRVIAKARKPRAQSKKERVVIVGGGSGGIHTIESLREHNFDGSITLLSKEPYAPIDRTKLSKGLVDNAQKIEWRNPAVLKDDFDVDLHLSTIVKTVDTEKQTVTTEDGKTVEYDTLVLAPGSIPKKIPIPGADLEGVITIRTVDDIKQVTSAIGPETDIIIIGTSFIGLEAAGALAKKELKSLTVVGVDEVPFEAMLSKEIGQQIVKSMEKQGIKFYLGANVEKVLPAEGDAKHCGSLQIKGQDPLPATLIIMGTGVRPATDFLKESGLTLEKDGGISVDKFLRVNGHKNVFAVGDIAHYPQFPDHNVRRVEHWNCAGNHARRVGQTIGSGTPSEYNEVPVFWSSVAGGLRYVGTGAGHDDAYFDGNVEELKFVLYQAKDGKVTTVCSRGRDPYVAKAVELFRTGKMPSLEEIKNGQDLLKVHC